MPTFPSRSKVGGASQLASRPASHRVRARSVFDLEIAGLQAVRAQIDEQFDATVELVLAAVRKRNKIVVVGVGKSGNIGLKIAATFNSIGASSVVLNSVDALHGDLGMVNDGDVVLLLSYSGETEELLNLLPALKRFSVKIIAMTGSPRSRAARCSDLLLNVKVPREACPFNLAPTSSTTAMLVMGDALAMALLHASGFGKQQFAKHHPGGAIGRSLLLRVADIMRPHERHAVAPENLTVREALAIMTQARSGTVSVTNARGKLVGVFTDGDLRRRLADGNEFLAQPLSSVMTKRPVVIRDDALAAEALKIFNERNIDDLIVVNSKMQPVGLIDSQDLPKLKLA